MSLPRERLLDAAKSLISGDRADAYGDAHKNFSAIADLWTAYLGRSENPVIDAHDVAVMMILLKAVRLANNRRHWDSWLDIAGYAGLGAELVNEDV